MKDLKEVVNRLNAILKKNNLTLIDEFEAEFINLEYEKESSTMIIYGNRQLIRKAYHLIVMMYGENATLFDFKTLINDHNDNGRKMIMEFSRKRFKDFKLQRVNEEIFTWFLNDYYSGLWGRGSGTQTYTYCLPTRYLIDKMIDTINIEKGIYSNMEEDIFESHIQRNKKNNNINDKYTQQSESDITICNSKTDISFNDIYEDYEDLL